MGTDISKKETWHNIVAFLKYLLPNKKHSFLSGGWRVVLIFCIIFGLIGIISSIQEAMDTRTPKQKQAEEAASARQERLRDYQGLLKDFPCVKLDDEPVAIQLEWLGDEVRFAAPKTYTFTGARFSQQTIILSRSKLLAADVYADHLFVSVTVKKRAGYSPEMFDSSVYISIPKSLVPSDFQPRSSGETAGEQKVSP
jgi:hypothetical protein